MGKYFTNIFENLSDEEKECFYKTVILNDTSSYAQKARDEYIWYATNGEIYEYVQAFDRLEFSADGESVYNPSAIDVYIQSLKGGLLVSAGKTV